jgi:hypothetical protein
MRHFSGLSVCLVWLGSIAGCASGPGSTDGGASLAAGTLFQGRYPLSSTNAQQTECLATTLALQDNGQPDCVVVTARFPLDSGSPRELDTCRMCADPGLEALDSSIPLDRIGADLSTYQCVCAITPSPVGNQCPEPDPTVPSWCYVAGLPTSCNTQAILSFVPGTTDDATVYVACFKPGTAN